MRKEDEEARGFRKALSEAPCSPQQFHEGLAKQGGKKNTFQMYYWMCP
jgi:hypothetical protein